MRDYEVVYIFKSSLTGEEIESRLDRYHEKILAASGAEITAVEHWGKRQLAYPIERNENGYYVVVQFCTEPAALIEYERFLKLDEGLLRYLVVLSEGELAAPPSAHSGELAVREKAGAGEKDEEEGNAPRDDEELDAVVEEDDLEDDDASGGDAEDDEAEE